jgi:hypothetical protein
MQNESFAEGRVIANKIVTRAIRGLKNLRIAFVRWCASLVFPALALVSSTVAQSRTRPAVAYSKGSSLTLVSLSGQVTGSFPGKHALFDFAISPNLKLLVAVTATTRYGGMLDLVRLDAGVRSRLVSGPVYFKHLPKGEEESTPIRDSRQTASRWSSRSTWTLPATETTRWMPPVQ